MSVGSMKSKFEKTLGQIHYKVDWGLPESFDNRAPQIRYDEGAKALTVVIVECKVGFTFTAD